MIVNSWLRRALERKMTVCRVIKAIACLGLKSVRTKYGLRTTNYGLGIKHGLRYKTRTERYRIGIKHEERVYIE